MPQVLPQVVRIARAHLDRTIFTRFRPVEHPGEGRGRILLATDALCGSCDESHDAPMTLYRMRCGHQVETATTDEILARRT